MLQAIVSVIHELSPWLLLGALVSGLMHAFLPDRFIARQLSGVGGVFKAVVFGVPLPLCSCGVIPAGVGLKKDGASDGAALGFLISTPQTGVDSVLVSAGMLGWPFALFKLGSAALLGVVGGLVAHRVGAPATAAGESGGGLGARPGLAEGFWHALQVLRSIWLWIVVGVVASAAITQWVPAASLARLGDSSPVLVYASVLLLSIPLYVCATASVPIAAALVAGGLPAGSALVFLVAGPATNVATIGAVAKTFGRPVLVVYLATLVVGSMVLGMSFDHLIPAAESLAHHHHEQVSWWVWLCSGGLTMVFAYFAVESLINTRGVGAAPMTKGWNVTVEGMTCGGCSSRLERVLNAHEAVDGAQVDLAAAKATVAGSISAEALVEVITGAGFDPGRPQGLSS